MWMIIGEHRFAITMTDNVAVKALRPRLPLALDMSELNGNEKYVRLPKALPVVATQPGTIRAGDLMLYGNDTLVIFYENFSSPYSYTRLGHIDDPVGLTQALGRDGVRVELVEGETSGYPLMQSAP